MDRDTCRAYPRRTSCPPAFPRENLHPRPRGSTHRRSAPFRRRRRPSSFPSLWEVEGRSTAEIAKELGIKESAVRHTVSRARASLRKVLSELIIDEARGLTALDLLSSTYKKAAKIAGKSSKIALTFILVLTAFLGLNSLTGNEPNTSLITTSSSQVTTNQDMPTTTVEVEQRDVTSKVLTTNSVRSISPQEYSDQMSLSLAQLETVTLMLQILDQTEGR